MEAIEQGLPAPPALSRSRRGRAERGREEFIGGEVWKDDDGYGGPDSRRPPISTATRKASRAARRQAHAERRRAAVIEAEEEEGRGKR